MKYLYLLIIAAVPAALFSQARGPVLTGTVLSSGDVLYTINIQDKGKTANSLCDGLTDRQGIKSCRVISSSQAQITTSPEILLMHLISAVRRSGFEDTYQQYKSEFRQTVFREPAAE